MKKPWEETVEARDFSLAIDGRIIGRIASLGSDVQLSVARARLYAAAPDLFRALLLAKANYAEHHGKCMAYGRPEACDEPATGFVIGPVEAPNYEPDTLMSCDAHATEDRDEYPDASVIRTIDAALRKARGE